MSIPVSICATWFLAVCSCKAVHVKAEQNQTNERSDTQNEMSTKMVLNR